MNQAQILRAKADGVQDCVKWLKKQIKQEKIDCEKRDTFYGPPKEEFDLRIQTLVSVKIGMEKYMKKLRHEADEAK